MTSYFFLKRALNSDEKLDKTANSLNYSQFSEHFRLYLSYFKPDKNI